MKRELTLTDIAGYLDHPLLGQHPTGAICWIDVKFIAQYGIALARYKPVLRPMSDLYVEITERGYNDGKPFVPILELANLLGSPALYQWILNSDGCCAFSTGTADYFRWLEVERSFLHSPSYRDDYPGYVICNQHEMYDLLHRLHFDYRGLIDAGLAVSVHDLKQNPYEAANN